MFKRRRTASRWRNNGEAEKRKVEVRLFNCMVRNPYVRRDGVAAAPEKARPYSVRQKAWYILVQEMCSRKVAGAGAPASRQAV